jgi:hypothetical protein
VLAGKGKNDLLLLDLLELGLLLLQQVRPLLEEGSGLESLQVLLF